MDKRSILFIFLATLTLFCVNLYFNNQRDEEYREWEKRNAVAIAAQRESVAEDLIKRQQPLSDLPIVKIENTWAVQDGNTLLALESHNNSLPDEVFVGASGPYKKMWSSGALVVFQTANAEKFTLPTLNESADYDIQLIMAGELATQTLGEMRDGIFSTPLTVPTVNAIGLVKDGKHYVPYGLYDAQEKVWVPFDHFPTINEIAAKVAPVLTAEQMDKEEKFFLLENDYAQLVFSNHGGAIVEVNLTLNSAEHPDSVVRIVEFDKQMVEQAPENARFPAHAYYTAGMEKHDEGELGGYYPLLRRDLFLPAPAKPRTIAPKHYACNIVSKYPELAELTFTVKEFDERKIVFEAIQSYRRITKTYTLPEDAKAAPYCVDLAIQIQGDRRGLWLTSGVPSVEIMAGGFNPVLKMRTLRGDKVDINKLDLPKEIETVGSIRPDWVCDSNGFFGLIVDPLNEISSGYRTVKIPGSEVPTRLSAIDRAQAKYLMSDYPGYEIQLPLKEGDGTMHFRYYAGPFDDTILNRIDTTYANYETGYNPDYVSCQSFHGWFSFISEPFAKFLFILMKFFHQVTHSWAASIVLLTVVLRLMLYPLNAWSMKSMRRMQKISPLVTEVQKKYKKEPKRAQIEVMNLYKKHRVNPMGGCFPILIQMPFLIGMFDLLRSTFQLRGAVFIPGWIDNLTAPDSLFHWSYSIPLIGNSLHVLPLLIGVVMFFQQKMSSTIPKDPAMWTDQQRQQRFMGNIMVIVFAVMFYNFPSGLNLYWMSSMLLGILQQYIVNKNIDNTPLLIDDAPAASSKKMKRT